MILRLSDSLGRKLKARPVALHPLNANAFADWSVHYTQANRAALLIVANTRSLYTVIAPGDGIVTLQSLDARVFAYVKDRLYADGFEFLYRRLVEGDGETTIYSKPLNPQSVGALNDLAELATYYLSEAGLDEDGASRKINDTPLSALNHRSPRATFQSMGF